MFHSLRFALLCLLLTGCAHKPLRNYETISLVLGSRVLMASLMGAARMKARATASAAWKKMMSCSSRDRLAAIPDEHSIPKGRPDKP